MPHLAAILNNRRSLFQRPLHCARLRCYYDEGGLFAFRDNMWRIVNHPARRQFPAKKVERGRDEQERSDSRERMRRGRETDASADKREWARKESGLTKPAAVKPRVMREF